MCARLCVSVCGYLLRGDLYAAPSSCACGGVLTVIDNDDDYLTMMMTMCVCVLACCYESCCCRSSHDGPPRSRPPADLRRFFMLLLFFILTFDIAVLSAQRVLLQCLVTRADVNAYYSAISPYHSHFFKHFLL